MKTMIIALTIVIFNTSICVATTLSDIVVPYKVSRVALLEQMQERDSFCIMYINLVDKILYSNAVFNEIVDQCTVRDNYCDLINEAEEKRRQQAVRLRKLITNYTEQFNRCVIKHKAFFNTTFNIISKET